MRSASPDIHAASCTRESDGRILREPYSSFSSGPAGVADRLSMPGGTVHDVGSSKVRDTRTRKPANRSSDQGPDPVSTAELAAFGSHVGPTIAGLTLNCAVAPSTASRCMTVTGHQLLLHRFAPQTGIAANRKVSNPELNHGVAGGSGAKSKTRGSEGRKVELDQEFGVVDGHPHDKTLHTLAATLAEEDLPWLISPIRQAP